MGRLLPLHRLKLGESFSEAARQLWLYIVAQGLSQADLCRRIGCKRSQLSRWLYGDGRPGVQWASRIEDLTGIAMRLWTLAPAEEFKPPAAIAA